MPWWKYRSRAATALALLAWIWNGCSRCLYDESGRHRCRTLDQPFDHPATAASCGRAERRPRRHLPLHRPGLLHPRGCLTGSVEFRLGPGMDTIERPDDGLRAPRAYLWSAAVLASSCSTPTISPGSVRHAVAHSVPAAQRRGDSRGRGEGKAPVSTGQLVPSRPTTGRCSTSRCRPSGTAPVHSRRRWPGSACSTSCLSSS